MRTIDLAWVAGIVEGEGSILITKGGGGIRVQVKMCDEDVVRRLHTITGIGYVNGPYPGAHLGDKPYWAWLVSRRQDASGLLMTLYPFFGERRQARAREALQAWKNWPDPLAPCGTRSAYHRHLRYGEETCKACREATNAYSRALKERHAIG